MGPDTRTARSVRCETVCAAHGARTPSGAGTPTPVRTCTPSGTAARARTSPTTGTSTVRSPTRAGTVYSPTRSGTAPAGCVYHRPCSLRGTAARHDRDTPDPSPDDPPNPPPADIASPTPADTQPHHTHPSQEHAACHHRPPNQHRPGPRRPPNPHPIRGTSTGTGRPGTARTFRSASGTAAPDVGGADRRTRTRPSGAAARPPAHAACHHQPPNQPRRARRLRR